MRHRAGPIAVIFKEQNTFLFFKLSCIGLISYERTIDLKLYEVDLHIDEWISIISESHGSISAVSLNLKKNHSSLATKGILIRKRDVRLKEM